MSGQGRHAAPGGFDAPDGIDAPEGIATSERAEGQGGATPLVTPAPRRRAQIVVGIVALAVLLIQMAFIASYAGALHSPEPAHVPVATALPAAQEAQLSSSLSSAHAPVDLHPVASATTARQQVRDGDVDGALVAGPTGLTLLTASAGGPAVTTVLETVFTPVAKAAGTTLTVQDVVPLPSGDPRGLVSFYLVIGWAVGGYLLSAVLGVSVGMTPTSLRAGLQRLALLAGYAVLSGIGGTLVVDAAYGYLTGASVRTAALGALVVLAVGASAMALQSMFGIIGTALVLLIFVVAGNPSAGGPWPRVLLASPWREVGRWLPNGAGLSALRDTAYFTSSHLTGPLLVLTVWAVVGIVITVLVARRGRPLAALPAAR